jgi:ABC-type transport system involved in multi-copper enzyme maturation permease subunit
MAKLFAALWAEYLKIKRSRILWLTILAFSIAPLMGALFVFIIRNPELAHNAQSLAVKAQMVSFSADWPSFLGILSQAIGVGGVLVFGFVASWVFGREYSDHTAKDLLALPVSRSAIVLSKMMAIFLWCLALSLTVLLLGLALGFMINLPGWPGLVLFAHLKTFFITAFLTFLLCPPVAFFASMGRGYLAPLGFVVFVLVMGQIIAALGLGAYFPWAVPGLFSGMAGAEQAQIPGFSYIILVMTSLTGFLGTLIWWHFADQV